MISYDSVIKQIYHSSNDLPMNISYAKKQQSFCWNVSTSLGYLKKAADFFENLADGITYTPKGTEHSKSVLRVPVLRWIRKVQTAVRVVDGDHKEMWGLGFTTCFVTILLFLEKIVPYARNTRSCE